MKKSVRERAALCPYIAALLRDLRDPSKHSQERFSELLDLSARSYSDAENGYSLCSAPTILRILNRVEDPVSVIRHCVALLDASKENDPDS